MSSGSIRSVGVIGLGKMGMPIARHLATHGFEVSGYDINGDACSSVAAFGGHSASSAKALAAVSELVIILVGFESEVDHVIFGPAGILEGARPGTTIAISSTVAPGYMKGLPDRVADRDIKFLDIPLCRGEPAAEAGELLLMGGGDAEVFERGRAMFSSFCTAIHYLGGLGAGQVGKMVNNLIMWASMSANHEGLLLADALGVEQEPLRQALLQSSARNWALETWLNDIPMPWAEKDISIALAAADQVRLSIPLCGVVKETVKVLKIARGQPTPVAR
jgi:3-hydroxyisobutyrate dehydrogenase-like beta-hydroxyacid dehydrogenase